MKVETSDKQGASAVIFTGPCHFIGLSFVGDTATEPTLTVYNAITATGTVVAFQMVSDECHTVNLMLPGKGIQCKNGLYAALSAAQGDYIIYYTKG